MTTPPIVVLPVAPRTPAPFLGEAYEDVEDWINQYDRVTRHNGWSDEQRLQNLYFLLEGTARHWLENHGASLTFWDRYKNELTRTFASQNRRARVEDLLQLRAQGPSETVTSFVQDVLGLSSRADPQATEKKKLRIVMRGLKDDIFGGLVRNPPTTVQESVTEATNMERAILARASHYHRHLGVAASAARGYDISPSIPDIRDIIREVVREELRKMLPASDRLSSLSLAEIVREEVHQAFQPEVPMNPTTPKEPALSYAAMAQRPPQANRQATAPLRRDPPIPKYPRRREGQVQDVRLERHSPRKTDVWRTADRRPLCYHCGEADHTYRRCPYRQMGLRGFHPKDPRPMYGERPRDIEEYLRRSPT